MPRLFGQTCLAVCIALVCAGDCIARTQVHRIEAAGDERNLWIIRPEMTSDGASFAVLHRMATDSPQTIRHLKTLTGQVAPHGIAAADDALWLVFTSGAVQYIRSIPDEVQGPWGAYEKRRLAPLPEGTVLRGLAAATDGPWVLVRFENAELLEAFEKAQRTGNENSESASSPANAAKDETSTPKSPADTASRGAESDNGATVRVPIDRLLQLRANHWRRVTLPDDWPHLAPSAIVMRRPDATTPTLVAVTKSPTSVSELNIFSATAPAPGATNQNANAPTWSSDSFDWPAGAAVAGIGVNRQVVLYRRVDSGSSDLITLELQLWRRGALTDLGQLNVAARSPTTPWSVAALDQTATLITLGDQGDLLISSLSTQGRVLHESVKYTQQKAPPRAFSGDIFVLMIALVVATAVMFIFWRRGQDGVEMKLAPDQKVADLGRRAAAAMIDLAPCVLLGTLHFEISVAELFRLHLPGLSRGGWEQMLPTVTTIGLVVIHTTISEMFSGRTLGKLVLGMHVGTMQGQKPKAWQALVRGVMRIFDLLAIPLLLVAVLTPHRQRLGDLMARTVVIVHVVKEGQDESEPSP